MRKTRRTEIRDLSTAGEELTETHLRLATGGTGGLNVAPTYDDQGRLSDTCTGPFPRIIVS